MKRLALINSYCNTWPKLSILHDNILKLKELGIDSLVYSPLPLPKEITEITDYTIISKENPIIHWPERGMIHWKNLPNFVPKMIVPDYGWASFYQYKKLMEYGSTLNYDYYYWFLYDVIIEDEVLECLNNPKDKLFFPHKKAKTSKVGALFASFNKKNIKFLHPLFNKELYKEVCSGGIAEKFLEYLSVQIQGEYSTYNVKDKFDEHGSLDFNVLNNQYHFKLALDNSKLLFGLYDLPPTITRVTFAINGLYYDFDVTPDNNLIKFNLDLNTIKSVIFYCKSTSIDLTSYYKSSNDIIRLIENP